MSTKFATWGLGAIVSCCLAWPLIAQDQKVNLNTATAAQLQDLQGVGPALSQRIIDFRKKNGPFKRIEDLMNVRGVGEKKFLSLKDRITVGKAPAARPASRRAKKQPSPAAPKKKP
ncbi:MAG: helix-hairpin-helix domain-containing protein [Acidobacteriota bacterium]